MRTLTIFCAALLLTVGQAAWAVSLSFSVGPGPGPSDPSLPNEFAFDNGGWIIGDPSARIEISHDPAAGQWVKQLSGIIDVQPGTTYVVHENLMVGPGLSWTDWHEEIMTPGWVWSSGDVTLPSGAPVPGLVTSGVNSSTIWFDFTALPPGSMIDIWKEITYVDRGGAFSGSITIQEFPTVPLPAAAWLFGSALLGLGAIKRRGLGVRAITDL